MSNVINFYDYYCTKQSPRSVLIARGLANGLLDDVVRSLTKDPSYSPIHNVESFIRFYGKDNIVRLIVQIYGDKYKQILAPATVAQPKKVKRS
jgi:hypothetical protein